jgi:hypothetical protein
MDEAAEKEEMSECVSGGGRWRMRWMEGAKRNLLARD